MNFTFYNSKNDVIFCYDDNRNSLTDNFVKEVINFSEILLEKENICYRKFEKIDGNDLFNNIEEENVESILITTITSPLTDDYDDYLATGIFFVENNFEGFIKEIIDIENYLIQTLLHIHMVLENYNKLFPIVDVFMDVISIRDDYMPYHMSNVALLAVKVAKKMELDLIDENVLYVASLIHDIGKVYVPDKIINKDGVLSDEEYNIIKNHSSYGEEVTSATLYNMDIYENIPKIIRYHHENYDGSGYPDQLKKDEIPLLSRILRVADAVDAMKSLRTYKEGMTSSQIIKELKRCKGKDFDPTITDVMIEIVKESAKSEKNLIFQ